MKIGKIVIILLFSMLIVGGMIYKATHPNNYKHPLHQN
jgi:hypothetical protein